MEQVLQEKFFGMISAKTSPWTGAGFSFARGYCVESAFNDSLNPNILTKSGLTQPVHIAIVADPFDQGTGRKKLYINNVECNTLPRQGNSLWSKDISSAMIWMFVGPSWANDTENSFIGKIYAARIYDRALSAEEMQQNYNTDKARFGI